MAGYDFSFTTPERLRKEASNWGRLRKRTIEHAKLPWILHLSRIFRSGAIRKLRRSAHGDRRPYSAFPRLVAQKGPFVRTLHSAS